MTTPDTTPDTDARRPVSLSQFREASQVLHKTFFRAPALPDSAELTVRIDLLQLFSDLAVALGGDIKVDTRDAIQAQRDAHSASAINAAAKLLEAAKALEALEANVQAAQATNVQLQEALETERQAHAKLKDRLQGTAGISSQDWTTLQSLLTQLRLAVQQMERAHTLTAHAHHDAPDATEDATEDARQ